MADLEMAKTNEAGRRVGYILMNSADDIKLQAARESLNEGDTLVVRSMADIARSLGALCRIIRELTADGVSVEFVKERLRFTPEGTEPHSELLLQTLGAVAAFERTARHQSQRPGIEKAKAKGRYRGRSPTLGTRDIEHLWNLAATGVPVVELAKRFKVSRETIYSYLRDKTKWKKRQAAVTAQALQTKRLRRKAPNKRKSR